MLFEDRGVAEALRSIELRDDLGAVFETDLINAVFVAVECEQMPVAAVPGRFDRGQDLIRPELGVRGFADSGGAHGASVDLENGRSF